MNVDALIALLRAHDLGIDARKSLVPSQIATITRWRERAEPIEVLIAREEAVRLARRVHEVTVQLAGNQKRMTEIIQQSPAAPLLVMMGAGAVTVATILTVGSHPGRVREISRYLMRFIARMLYRQLNTLYGTAELARSHVAGADGSGGVP